jgi:hypothetical protein
MNFYTTVFALALAFCLSASSALAQVAEELRPFDFQDKYYYQNGVLPDFLIGRKNGADGESVVDFTDDFRYSTVRVTATRPAYDEDGKTIFWNHYAGLPKNAFTDDENGSRAIELAFSTPLYIFPSTTVKNSDRQAALIRTRDTYFEKNQIGVSAVFLVEYTEFSQTKLGRAALQSLAKRNGLSLDGTPIIKTEDELYTLRKEGLVTFFQPSSEDNTPFAIAKVIQYPAGGITPDAFLIFVKGEDGKPLAAEAEIVSKFECFQGSGNCL